tara:strand:- start:3646 stop:4290 length:645 start_codon:yes stop_codon:yes gene_type:complete
VATISDADGVFTIGWDAPSHGTVTDNNGAYIYTPEGNFNGTDSFELFVVDNLGEETRVTIVITVMAINDAPVAEDFTVLCNVGESCVFDLSSAISDVDEFDGFITEVTGYSTSATTTLSSHVVTWTSPTTAGIYTLTYRATDYNGLSDTGTVTLEYAVRTSCSDATDCVTEADVAAGGCIGGDGNFSTETCKDSSDVWWECLSTLTGNWCSELP